MMKKMKKENGMMNKREEKVYWKFWKEQVILGVIPFWLFKYSKLQHKLKKIRSIINE